MSHILMLYGTGEGQTEKIARTMAVTLRARGQLVTLVRGDKWCDVESMAMYDAVIIGASIHADAHQPYVLDWIKQHRDALAMKPSAFFSVSLSARDRDGPGYVQAAQYVLDVMTSTHWSPDATASFGGAIHYSRLGFFKKFRLMFVNRHAGEHRDVAHECEYTDWAAVAQFADAFGRMLTATRASVHIDDSAEQNDFDLKALLTL